jgi:hypothetical protein
MIQVLLYVVVIMSSSEWGFFGHKLINRTAVYTLPTEMIGWYKPYIDYLSEHAVDPDKRRYASKFEAVRHYIDLDHWGETNFDHLPRYLDQTIAYNLEAYSLNGADTIFYLQPYPYEQWTHSLVDYDKRLKLVRQYYMPQFYSDLPSVSCDSLHFIFPEVNCNSSSPVFLHEVFTQHGIVPYHLQDMERRLTNAFKGNDLEAILRLSAELGHYVADACVPLHTTSNYNGQQTNQVGIHAFWESRIPELFATEEFDMVVGTATYIDNPVDYFWSLVFDSHKEVAEVLNDEKELSQTYPSDEQFCFEDRLNQNIRTQCPEYTRAYHIAMDKMVEDRFRVAVKSVGDAWYTAWVNAGQPTAPPLKALNKRNAEDEELDKAYQSGQGNGRDHE